jgi:hypothetical protein
MAGLTQGQRRRMVVAMDVGATKVTTLSKIPISANECHQKVFGDLVWSDNHQRYKLLTGEPYILDLE